MANKVAQERLPEGVVDYSELERYLAILADPSRLRLLHLLRTPRTIDEIELTPHRTLGGQRPERPMTRQAIRNHLYVLTEAELVRVRLARRDSRRSLQEFVVDHARLFAIMESLREISGRAPAAAIDPSDTLPMDDLVVAPSSGVRLVHVNGPHEGKAIPLERFRGANGAIVGRGNADILLDYDPFISRKQAELLWKPDGLHLIDLRAAANPTLVNWRECSPGEDIALRHGDIVRVGRSLLLLLER